MIEEGKSYYQIKQIMGLKSSHMQLYSYMPEIVTAYINRVKPDTNEKPSIEKLIIVEQAIEKLRKNGERISVSSIRKELGVSYRVLDVWGVTLIIKKAAENQNKIRKLQDSGEFMRKASVVIGKLKEEDRLSFKEVFFELGTWPLSTMKRFPEAYMKIYNIVKEHKARKKHEKEEELIARAREVFLQIENNSNFSKGLMLKLLGMYQQSLKHYPRLEETIIYLLANKFNSKSPSY